MKRIAPYRLPLSALAVLCLTATASAADTAGRGSAVQLSLSEYQPSIDDQFSSKPGPYETVFGAQGDLMFEVGWEGHLVRDYGALTAGLTAGYWSIEGKTRLEDGSEGGDTTTFQIVPLGVQLSYRFDMFAETHFPLAPSARIGVDYYLWRILDGSDDVAQFSAGNEAQGGTYGWHGSLGLHLLLDFFAPDMAVAFERNAGVYNSFLFVEYRYSQIDEFGSATSFRLGDDHFVFGLALEL